ncbi:MAG: beta strand repeat-containing protein [Chthoniobacterales bacterium]
MERLRQARALSSTLFSVAVFCCVLGLRLEVARAAIRTWNGGGASDDTSLAANWGTTGAPIAGDALQFGGTLRLTPNQVAALSIASLTFNTGAGAFVLGGNTYTLSAGVTNSSAATQTINNAITLSGASQTWSATSGSLVFGGNIDMGTTALSIGGNFNTTINNIVSGSGTFTKTGTGILALAGANTYTGQSSINAGSVSVNSLANLASPSALGAPMTSALGTIKIGATTTGGTLIYTGGTTTTNRVIDLAGTTGGATIDASGSGALTFTSALTATGAGVKTLTLTGSSTAANTFAGAIVDNSAKNTTALVKNGTGTWTLSGTNTYSGTTTVNGGVLNLQSNAALGLGTGGTTVASGAALQIQGANLAIADALTLRGTGISNDGALRNISGNNTVSGAVTLGANTTVGADAGNLTLSGVVSGAFSLTKVGAGTLTLSNSNTFSGAVAIQNGTISVVGSGLGTGTSAVGLGASGTTGTLQYTGATTSSTRPLTLATGGAGIIDVSSAASTLTLSSGASISGSGSFEKSGAGTLVLGTANTFTGSTTINAGTLTLGNATALGPSASAAVVFGASSTGRLQLNGNNTTIVGLNTNALVGTPVIESGSATAGTDTLTVNTANSDSYGGVLQNGSTRLLALTKSGSGTLTLSGANTYTGSTTVNGGTLILASAGSALGSTASVTVNSGGTLLLGGSNQINDTATVTLAGGTIAKGNFSEGTATTPGMGALTLTATGSHIDFGTGSVGVLNFASFTPGSFTLMIDNWSGTANMPGGGASDRLIFDTSQSSNLGNFSFTGFLPGATQFDLGNGYYEITPTAAPEPSTYAAAVLAALSAGYHLVRRRRAAQSKASVAD